MAGRSGSFSIEEILSKNPRAEYTDGSFKDCRTSSTGTEFKSVIHAVKATERTNSDANDSEGKKNFSLKQQRSSVALGYRNLPLHNGDLVVFIRKVHFLGVSL